MGLLLWVRVNYSQQTSLRFYKLCMYTFPGAWSTPCFPYDYLLKMGLLINSIRKCFHFPLRTIQHLSLFHKLGKRSLFLVGGSAFLIRHFQLKWKHKQVY